MLEPKKELKTWLDHKPPFYEENNCRLLRKHKMLIQELSMLLSASNKIKYNP